MKNILLSKIEKIVVDYYLKSCDFNGLSLANIINNTASDYESVSKQVSEAIRTNKLRIISPDHEMNPHIIREGFQDIEIQLKSIIEENVKYICVYPTKELLNNKVSSDLFHDKPFTRMLALGSGQLEIVYFELELLEHYRNDPRYYYECNDIGGSICIGDEYYENIEEKNKILLKAFGLAYDEDSNRYIAAFIGDLAELSPEHQTLWRSKLTTKKLIIHPDFYGSQILNKWPEHMSIFDAVLHGQRIINSMLNAMGKSKLFKKDFGRYLENKPKEFAFMLRPTLNEYGNFILLLDKLMSDNIDKDFFKKENITLESEEVRKDGRIQVTPKGTIKLLDEWLRKVFSTNNWEPWEVAIEVFKRIRKERQSPAHKIKPNKYDSSIITKQRELMKESYYAIMILQHALSIHPRCVGKDFNIPEAYSNKKIWTI